MSRELVLRVWCDMHDESQQVEATGSVVAAINGARPLQLDVCDDHQASVIDPFVVALGRWGTPPDKAPIAPIARRARSAPTQIVQQDGVPPCPECGYQNKTRSALGQHLKVKHGLTMSGAGLAMPGSSRPTRP